MTVRPFIRQTGGNKYYLPGDVESDGIQHSGGLEIPSANVPQDDGVVIYDSGIKRKPELITVSGVIRESEYATDALLWTDLATFLTNIRARTTSSKAVEFGWYNSVTAADIEYARVAYVQDWHIKKSAGLPYKPWIDAAWSVSILVPDPTTWTTDSTSTPATDIHLLAPLGKIILVVGTSVDIQDASGTVVARVDATNGNADVSGDYGYL